MSITPERWKEIEELYHASVDQAPEIRDALLEKTSPEVREIVKRLLSQEETGILDRPACNTDEPSHSDGRSEASTRLQAFWSYFPGPKPR